MKNFSLILSTVAVILAVVALVRANGGSLSSGLTADAVAEAVQQNPEKILQVFENYQQNKIKEAREAQEKAEREALAKYLPEINSDANAPSFGPKDAKVTVVEFFDFSCGYCKALAPSLEKVMADNADVKFIFKPVSFVTPVSKYQAKAAYAANKQGKFLAFYKAVMAFNGRMSEADVDNVAKNIGLDMDQYKANVEAADISKSLDEVSALANNIGINGVPTVLINGKKVQGMNPHEFQAAIDEIK